MRLTSSHVAVFLKLVKVPVFVKLFTFVKVPLVNSLVRSVNMAHSVDAKTRSEWIIIGISGVTCGGKTSLARQLLAALEPVQLFHQDEYFFPDDSARHERCQHLDHNNYDVLGALDMESFYRDIVATLQGRSKAHARYPGPPGPGGGSQEGGERAGRLSMPGKKKQFLILEGFTVLNYKPINELCDLRYYFILEYGECAARRALRVYSPPDVPGYFEQCVWPAHLHYRAEIERDARVRLLDGAAPGALDAVLGDLRARGARNADEIHV